MTLFRGRPLRRGFISIGCLLAGLAVSQGAVTDAVVSKKGPNLNQGRVKGSVRVMSGDNLNLNSGLTIDGSLILPGNPEIRVNGGAASPSVQNGGGSAEPSDYRVTLNGGVSLGGITRMAEAAALPVATAPAAGAGNRSVHINQPGDSPGNFATLRSLTINAQGASITLPPGRYERITLNGASTLNLQAGTIAAPALYEIQQIDINGGSHISVAGPVAVRLKNSLNLNGYVGDSAHPEWLEMSISDGSLTLNSQSAFHGRAVVPSGTLTVNGNSLLHGLAFTNRLTLNGNGIIECEGSGGTPNLAPVATAGETSTAIATPVAIPLVAADPENAPLTYQITTPPANGNVTLAGAVATYTPNAGFVGNDTFFFKASDGTLDSEPAAFVIHVFQPNRAPLAVSPVFVVNQGETNAPVVLSASDPDDDAITYQIATHPALGTILGDPPTLTYSHTGPRSTAVVEDTFTYTATDSKGAVSAIATVTLQLQPVNRPPTASPLASSGNEDSVVTLSLAAEDPDGDALDYEIVADPANPTATAGPLHGILSGVAPQLIYHPVANFHGEDRFYFRVKDSVLSSAVAEVTITVLPVNDEPVAVAKSLTGHEDGTITIAFDATDVDGDALSYTTTLRGGFPGTVTLSGAGAIFTPEANFNGAAAFTYTATDSSGSAATAEVSLEVTPVNDAPVVMANPAPLTLAEDSSLTFTPVGSDSDGDVLIFEITAQPEHGTLTPNPDGSYLYTPSENFNGADSFTYTARDAETSAVPVTVGISVTSRDDAPLAYAASYTLAEDGTVPTILSGLDVDGDPLVFEIVSQPQNGSITGNPPNLIYTPTENFNGSDSLSFKVIAGEAESAVATITFIPAPINDTPVAVAANLATDEDSTLPVALAATDIENDALTYEVTVQPQHGSLSGTAPDFTYTPAANYNGPDSFIFIARDPDTASSPATVSIVVRPINDVPVATNLAATTGEDNPLEIHLAATDVDDAELSFSITTAPAHGTLTGTASHFTYTPEPNFNGTETFSYLASDSVTSSAPATFTISVTPVADPPVAIAAIHTLQEDSSITLTLSGSDPDGDSLVFEIVSINDGQTGQGPLVTGEFQSHELPQLTFTPLADAYGESRVSFTVNDGTSTSAPAVVRLIVSPVADPPVADDVSAATLEDNSTAILLSGHDPDGEPVTYRLLTSPQHGTLAGEPPAMTYTPAADYNGSDLFLYEVNDGSADSRIATATLTVLPADDAPIATPQTLVVRQRESLAITLAGTSADGDTLHYQITQQPVHGTLTGVAPELVYTPFLPFTGLDQLKFTAVSDRSGLISVPAAIDFTVTPNNAPPLAPDLDVTVDGAPVAIVLPGSDPENLPLTYSITTNSDALSKLTITGTAPNLTLTRRLTTATSTSFTYKVTDDLGLTATGSVRVNILLPNRAPFVNAINPATISVAEDSTTTFSVTASDPDNDPLAYAIELPPGSPCVIQGAGPNYLLRFAPNFTGNTFLTARVSDGRGGTATRGCNISVSAQPDAPVATVGTTTTAEDMPLELVISAVDPEGAAVSYSLVSGPLHGVLEGTLPALRYIPHANFNGSDGLVFSVSDGVLSAPLTVPLTVTPVNDPPLAGRVMAKVGSLTTALPLQGTDPDGDLLSYRLLTPPTIGTAAISGNLLTFTTTEPFLGSLRVSYVANDGAVDSEPALLVLTGGVAPEARILSPLAGARLPMGEAVAVHIEAHDPDGRIVRYELFANGSPVATSTSPALSWIPAGNGAIAVTVQVTDDSGFRFTTAPLHLGITGGNQAPVVFAGSDRNVFALGLGPNLIKNGSCELPLDANGKVPFWETPADAQVLTRSNVDSFKPAGSPGYNPFPVASEGAFYFGPTNATNWGYEHKTEIATQTVTLDPDQPAGTSYQFRARLYAHTWGLFTLSNKELRQPRVELRFLDAAGGILETRLIQGKIPENTWYPVQMDLQTPAGAMSLKVSLIGHREPGYNIQHHSLIDDASLSRVLEAATVSLAGVVTDDGLPATGELSQRWTQIGGAPVEIINPASLNPSVGFASGGEYVFKLSATDGEMSASDTVAINVGTQADENAPPVIGLASEMDVFVGGTGHPLVATVTDDGKPNQKIYHYWEQLAGPSPAAFADPTAATTSFFVSVPGSYVFRLTSHDGQLAAHKEIAVQARCDLTRQPLDLYIITDHSGSMFGPEPGVITDYDPRTPIYQARKLVGAIINSLDPAVDRVSINQNNSYSTGYGIGGPMTFTSDFEIAKNRVVRPEGEFPLMNQGESMTLLGISNAVPFVEANGRSNAKKIILHLNDGVAGATNFTDPGFSGFMVTSQMIAQKGIVTMSVTMPNMKNDPIDRLLISNYVTSPAHAFFVDSLLNPGVIDNFFKVALAPLCRGFSSAPVIFAGGARYLPTTASQLQPQATAKDDQGMDALTFHWEQSAGPANVQFSDSDVLRPWVSFSQPGRYVLKLSVSDGASIVSDTVLVQVGASTSTPTPGGLIAYWAFDGSMKDLVEGRSLAPQFPHMPPAFVEDAPSGQALDLAGRTYPFHQVDGPLFDLDGAETSMAISFWCKPTLVNNNGKIFQFEGYSPGVSGTPYDRAKSFDAAYYNPSKYVMFNYARQSGGMGSTFNSSSTVGTVMPQQWNHQVISYDKVEQKLSIYSNGVLSNTMSTTGVQIPIFARNGQGLCIGPAPYNSNTQSTDRGDPPTEPFFSGAIDELAVFNRSLTGADVVNLFNREEGLTPPNLNPAPVVSAGPDRNVSLGQPVVRLEGLASDDDEGLVSSWRLQSGPAGGVEIGDLALPDTLASFTAPGIYTFELSADDGYHFISDTVEFRVDQTCQAPLPDNAFFWFKANGDTRDSVGGNDLSWIGQPGYVAGKSALGFDFNGTNGTLESEEALAAGGLAEVSFEGWFKDHSEGLKDQMLFEIAAKGSLTDSLSLKVVSRVESGKRYIYIMVPLLADAGTTGIYLFSTSQPNTNIYPLGEFFHLAISVSRARGVSFYINGALIKNEPLTRDLKLNSSSTLRLGRGYPGQGMPKLSIDEFTMYSKALQASEIFSIYQAGSAGKCPPWAQSPANSGFVDAGESAILPQPAVHTFAGSYESADFAADPSLSWSLVEGPAPVELSGANTLTPSASFSVPGRYVFKLAVTDGTMSGSDTVLVDLLQARNSPPVIDWAPQPTILQLPDGLLDFAPTVSDDGLPAGTLHGSWRLVGGPGLVTFTELEDTANPYDVSARFPTAGTYEVEFLASDSMLSTSQRTTVTVLAAPVPPLPNTAPVVSLGEDFTATTLPVQLSPTVLDDGKPANQLTATWNYEQGPAAPRFEFPADATGAEATVNFPVPGIYIIRLAVSDGEFSHADTVTIEVPDSLFGGGGEPGDVPNAAPTLAAISPQVVALPATELDLLPVFTDADGPATSYSYQWEQVNGPALLEFSNPSGHATTIRFPEIGTYGVKFTLTDGPYIRTSHATLYHLAAPNAPPTLALNPAGGTASPLDTVTLTATATDDGGPGALVYEWDWLSSPSAGAPVFSAPASAETQVTFPAAGDYLLHCRVSDGQLSTGQTISYRVVGAPFLAIMAPQSGGTMSDATVPETHVRAHQEGGSVSSVILALDGISLGQARLQPDTVDYFLQLPPMLHGSHSLAATATFADGTVLTQTSNFKHADFAEESLVLEIDSPHSEMDAITAPVPVIGTVRSPVLKDYKLELSFIDTPETKKLLGSGSGQMDSATLATLDPTLLENGIYTLTLSGTTTNGLFASISEKVLLDGNMKLGQFSLAFEDLGIDLPGTPLSITRTYDSRDAKGGDFGPGWVLATHSVKLRKTRPLNVDWEQSVQADGFLTNWIYSVQPTRRKRVIISFPGGRTETFETRIRSTNPLSPDQPFAQRYAPVNGAGYDFVPVGSTEGKLQVDSDKELLWASHGGDLLEGPVQGEFAGASEASSNPTRFRYTEPGGVSYIIDETQGLMSVSEPNGNTLSINRNGIYHSAGESVLLTRNAAGRITQITDPAGKKVNYTYDSLGRLTSFLDRAGNPNSYVYGLTAFPHYLTEIKDGLGVRAIRSAYDTAGRMVSQTDATGKTIAFTHDVSNRRETITDRLGRNTTHEFDENGNVTRTTDALGGLTTRTYDANDNETGTTTPLGHTTARAFDAKNNLLRETDPLGNISRYSYDAEKRPLTIVDALSHATSIAYDGIGNLTSMTDPAGAATNFSYSGSGNIATLTDANGTTTSYTRDAKGREKSTKVTAADGTVISSDAHDYDTAGNRIRTITTDGTRFFTTTFTYDSENRLTGTSYPDGSSSGTTYNQNGQVATEYTVANNVAAITSHTYDTRGNVIKTTHPGVNRFTSATFDAEGRQTSATDLSGATTYTLYDALGRATATILPDDAMPPTVLAEVADIAAAPTLADNPRTLTTYDADGRVTATIDALGNSTTFEYDAAGRRTAVIDALGNRMSYAYDAAGRQTSSTDAKGNVSTFTYDAAGRLARTDLPDGNSTLTGYDTLGRRISSTDAEGNLTRFAYDGAGRLIAVTDALGGITRYGYDQRGQQTTQTDALGRTTRYEYDVMGRRTARVLPGGERETLLYNQRGLLAEHTDFNGQKITRTYEAGTNNLLSIVAPAAHPSLALGHAPARYDFTYDVAGRRKTATVKNKLGGVLSSETYGYDIRSQLSGYTGPTGSIGYGYDLAGNLAGAKSATAGGYDVSYDYDALNRLTDVYRGQQGIDPAATGLAAYNYDQNGNLNGVGYANGVQHAYTYNALNRLTNLTVGTGGPAGPTSPLQGYAYQLNKNGHRTQISELSGRTIQNTFDALHRLTAESISTSSLITDHRSLGTLSYSYDPVGNRQSRTTSGTVSQIIPSQAQSFTPNDRLTSDTYDANGNTTSSLITDHSALITSSDVYSFDNKLIRRTNSSGTTIDLTYNPDGHRLTKLVSQGGLTQRLHHYLTDSNNPTGYAQVIEEKDPLAPSGSELKKVHHYGHDLVSTEQSDSSTPHSALRIPHFYQYDGLGSVRGISDQNGDLEESYDYDAYGTLIGLAKRNATTGDLESVDLNSSDYTLRTPRSEFLFTGEQWDADLVLYFLRARYMIPGMGRFLTQDVHEGSGVQPVTLNKYLYANGSPIMVIDPSGNFGLVELSITVGYYGMGYQMADSSRVLSLLAPIGSGLVKLGAAYAREYLDGRGYYSTRNEIDLSSFNKGVGMMYPVMRTFLISRFEQSLRLVKTGVLLNMSASIGSRAVSLAAYKTFTQEAEDVMGYLGYLRAAYSAYGTFKFGLPDAWVNASPGIASTGDISDIHLMLLDFKKWVNDATLTR